MEWFKHGAGWYALWLKGCNIKTLRGRGCLRFFLKIARAARSKCEYGDGGTDGSI